MECVELFAFPTLVCIPLHGCKDLELSRLGVRIQALLLVFELLQGVQGHQFWVYMCRKEVFCIEEGDWRVVKLMGLGLSAMQCSGFVFIWEWGC